MYHRLQPLFYVKNLLKILRLHVTYRPLIHFTFVVVAVVYTVRMLKTLHSIHHEFKKMKKHVEIQLKRKKINSPLL
jgi:hypothetical protein